MLGYVMVGTNDLARATKFYDATLESLNLVQVEGDVQFQFEVETGLIRSVAFAEYCMAFA